MHVLVSEKTAAHLPVCQINPMRSIHSTLKKYLTEIFGAEIPAHKVTWTVLVGFNELTFSVARNAFTGAQWSAGQFQWRLLLDPPHICQGQIPNIFTYSMSLYNICKPFDHQITLFQVPLESVCLIDKYSWLETERTLGDQLIARLGKNMTVPLAVIRWSIAFTQSADETLWKDNAL